MNPKPEFVPLAVPEELSDQILSFHGDPSVWWIGQILKFIARPNSDALRDLDVYINTTGLSHPYIGYVFLADIKDNNTLRNK